MEKKEINNCFEAVLEESKIKSKKFNNKVFGADFDRIKGMCEASFLDIFASYHEQEDEALLKEYAIEFVTIASAKMNTMSKREKSCSVMDYNLGLVTFVFPIIMSIPDSAAGKFVDLLVEDWNTTFNASIAKSTREGIESGFRSGWCYITTAVCESQEKPDDCYELNLLRQYRDEYLIKETADGEAIVKEYYNIAPTIVKRINKREDSAMIYNTIWENHLQTCISLIEKNEKEACKDEYINMVETLKREYFN